MRRGGTPVWTAGILAVILLVAAGVGYRAGAKRLDDPPAIAPLVSLAEMPIAVGQWKGQDLEIPTVTMEYMEANFADDYVSRRYTSTIEGTYADAYVVYCASRPGGLLGHQPMVCFPAHGWIHDETVPSEFVSQSGRRIPCLIHRFHKPAPAYRSVLVLSFYVLNGQITLSERDFSGLFGRRPNISGDPARYVAQVQISSVLEHSARALACDLADSVLDILPDEHGRVRWPNPPMNAAHSDGTAR
jgi:uncharacterized protein DUF3485